MITSINDNTQNLTTSILSAKFQIQTKLDQLGLILNDIRQTVSRVSKETTKLTEDITDIKDDTKELIDDSKGLTDNDAIKDLLDELEDTLDEITIPDDIFDDCTSLYCPDYSSECNGYRACTRCVDATYSQGTSDCVGGYCRLGFCGQSFYSTPEDELEDGVVFTSDTSNAGESGPILCMSLYEGSGIKCNSYSGNPNDPDSPMNCDDGFTGSDGTECKSDYVYGGIPGEITCKGYSDGKIECPESYISGSSVSCKKNFVDEKGNFCSRDHRVSSSGGVKCLDSYEGEDGTECSTEYTYSDGNKISCAKDYTGEDGVICTGGFVITNNGTICVGDYETETGDCLGKYKVSSDGKVECLGGFTNHELGIECPSEYTQTTDGVESCRPSYVPDGVQTCSKCHNVSYTEPCDFTPTPECEKCFQTDYCEKCHNVEYFPIFDCDFSFCQEGHPGCVGSQCVTGVL